MRIIRHTSDAWNVRTYTTRGVNSAFESFEEQKPVHSLPTPAYAMFWAEATTWAAVKPEKRQGHTTQAQENNVGSSLYVHTKDEGQDQIPPDSASVSRISTLALATLLRIPGNIGR